MSAILQTLKFLLLSESLICNKKYDEFEFISSLAILDLPNSWLLEIPKLKIFIIWIVWDHFKNFSFYWLYVEYRTPDLKWRERERERGRKEDKNISDPVSVADGWVHEFLQGLTNLQQIHSPFISFVSTQCKCTWIIYS